MRTTVRLDDALLEKARREAARRGTTLTFLIQEGLKRVLAEGSSERKRRRVRVPVSQARGGLLAGVDLNDSSDLLDRLEGRA